MFRNETAFDRGACTLVNARMKITTIDIQFPRNNELNNNWKTAKRSQRQPKGASSYDNKLMYNETKVHTEVLPWLQHQSTKSTHKFN